MIVVLAGGTGGAKLARGMLDVVGSGELAVIANTGDDVEVYGVHVSPDPDLVAYWLADVIDDRGWGIRGDTWQVMAAIEAAGRPAWFRLGDRDLAMCLVRTELLRAGARLTEAQAEVVRAVGDPAPVLPMADEPVRTHVRSGGRWWPFQEFMVAERAAGPVEADAVRGAADARPTPEVLEALVAAQAIVIGPSNPVISIGPILAVPGVREALAGKRVAAVSPVVDGRALRGPLVGMLESLGHEPSAAGVAGLYGELLTTFVVDPADAGLATDIPGAVVAPIVMVDPDRRAEVGRAVLEAVS